MKRQPSGDIKDAVYSNKKRSYLPKVCVICRTSEKRLHRVTASEAQELSKLCNLDIRPGQRACCRHWEYHEVEIFKGRQRPGLKKQFATVQLTAAPLRKPPPERKDPPPKSRENLTKKQLLALLVKTESELEVERDSKESLKLQLEAIQKRPFAPVLAICEEQAQDGSFNWLGM